MSVIATRQQIGRSRTQPRLDKGKTRAADVEQADLEKGSASASASDAAEESDADDSLLGVAREIIREEGVTGLWLGIKPSLVLTVNPAITYGAYERVKGLLLVAREKAGAPPGTKLGPWSAFVLGALSKTLATVVRILLTCPAVPYALSFLHSRR